MRDIFKISIYENILNINNQELLNYILKLKKTSKGVHKSNPTGWQSYNLNLTENIFSELNKRISENFLKYINEIPLKNDFQIESMWANVNGYKDYNTVHGHSNSVISGVYYLKVPKKCGNIFFQHPYSQMIEVFWDKCVEKDSDYNVTCANAHPSEGKLILFPSWLQHGVEPNLNKKEGRISISFNINTI